MKYKVECKSLLLQKTLENFLDGYLDEDGLVISDYEGDIIIGKDIKKPFTKSQLLIQLENLEKKPKNLEIDMSIFNEITQPKIKTKSFDEKLDELIDEFSQKLKKLIKEEYGKK